MAKQPNKTRVKSAVQTLRVQTREEAELMIKELGDKQRELQRLTTAQNDEIADITKRYAEPLQALKEEVEDRQQAIQAYCESHRDELTKNGKQKTGYFNTGEVQWRQNPPSVRVLKADQVIENLKLLGLTQFIRTKEEINKDAILLEPETAQTVAGITIKSGVEEFVIKPFEQEVK
ncbi:MULTISPECIES: host-nuclease inhibitor Gam family protein [Mannheimia]|uniref:Host-nuclease inhibitor Gam family protein n=1 Tax=Mannheimia cairinae TaxID=3025936 RepID=A0ABT5MQG3_9PAST|nr:MULTISPECIES: host-nuclease inhibitor Gam family protein [Mannheimia]AJE07771.1 host-nuclease inhibitor protein Gam [Mannheimia haemolytica USDA-ARS-USMARC-184]MDD0823731.1 host-nuclease inhibitor Gam family protein [Mannheimia cairinae]MDD0825337.1 host-nuclease inhibitor Gam family protein [Mannheimia cairinae]UQX63701.1 host-nuclease inhibitor Gam family protein [Mannheimia haemolytica]